MELYDICLFMMTPTLCFSYYYMFNYEKRIRINDKPKIYYIKSYKNLDLWYSEEDFYNFRN
jgi:hypothetical protein